MVSKRTNATNWFHKKGLGSVPGRCRSQKHMFVRVSVISTATNSVVATIAVGNAPVHVAITPDGTRAYVTNAGSQNVR
jgi:hypothetical protein